MARKYTWAVLRRFKRRFLPRPSDTLGAWASTLLIFATPMPQNPPPFDAALAQALADHRAGHAAAAEKAYRALLGTNPRHAGANHHLGVLLIQAGRMEEGFGRLKSALECDAAQPLYYFSLAKAHLASG